MKRTGKPYEGKPHVRFDEKMLGIGYGWDIVTLSEETERNREYKHQPVATTPVFYSTHIFSTPEFFYLSHKIKKRIPS